MVRRLDGVETGEWGENRVYWWDLLKTGIIIRGCNNLTLGS